MLAAQLLVGPCMPDRFQTRCHTMRDMLALQVGGWAWGCHHYRIKIVSNPGNGEAMDQKWKFHRRRQNTY